MAPSKKNSAINVNPVAIGVPLTLWAFSSSIKRQVLQLYLEGLGFRFIGRFLKCSHVAAYNWIKAHGEFIESNRFAQ